MVCVWNLSSDGQALLASCETKASLEDESKIRLIALFDNEEVGSESAYGAGSNLLESTLRRLTDGPTVCIVDKTFPYSPPPLCLQGLFDQAMAKSYFISADMAHAGML